MSTLDQTTARSSPIKPSLPPDCGKNSEAPKITLMNYDSSGIQEVEVKGVEECFIFKESPSVTWINIDCLHQPDILEKLGACYGFHPLVLEDILSDQRPKIEDYDDYIFMVLKMLYYDEEKREESISIDQISLILGPNFVVSF